MQHKELNDFEFSEINIEQEPANNIACRRCNWLKNFSGAKSRVQRGRQMLKDSLMNCCHYEFDKYGTIISAHPIKCCCCNKYQDDIKSTA